MNESTDERGARRRRQRFWFPLLVFAALAIASVPFSTGGGPVGGAECLGCRP